MAIISTSPLSLITEASRAEDFEVDNTLTDLIISDIKGVFSDIPECAVDLDYTVEMVNVIEDNEDYYVELSDISKYMISQRVTTVKEALNNIAESNSIPNNRFVVVIESQDYFDAFIEAAKKDEKKEKELKGAAKLIDKLKKNKIKVVKKESCKKESCKK